MSNMVYIVTCTILVTLILISLINKRISSTEATKEANKFLDTNRSKIKRIIIDYINNMDLSKIIIFDNPINNNKREIINDIINELNSTIFVALIDYNISDKIKSLIKSILNNEFIYNYIEKMIQDDEDIRDVYATKYVAAVQNAYKESIKYEQQSVNETSTYQSEDLSKLLKAATLNPDKIYDYTNGTRENPGVEIEHEIIPPVDDSTENVDPTVDNSVELVEEQK